VRAEFLEMPGLKLTIAQAQRLWGIDRATCEAAIEELIACRFLARTRDGAFVLRAAMV
jgi:Fic family protein